mmetsp:Transcript_16736/g.34100  ORF Transcript_16736/g.34100 Transcript_16736/m.34100 type:complete len:210 (-) Transcript_16736:69-698(-)
MRLTVSSTMTSISEDISTTAKDSRTRARRYDLRRRVGDVVDDTVETKLLIRLVIETLMIDRSSLAMILSFSSLWGVTEMYRRRKYTSRRALTSSLPICGYSLSGALSICLIEDLRFEEGAGGGGGGLPTISLMGSGEFSTLENVVAMLLMAVCQPEGVEGDAVGVEADTPSGDAGGGVDRVACDCRREVLGLSVPASSKPAKQPSIRPR